MSERYPGGIISKTAPTPTGPYESGTAPGIWTLEQQMQYQQQGIWPTAGLQPNYIEDVFSTYLYNGNSSTQTITNGINLSANDGLVWIKARNGSGATRNHRLWTTNLTGSKVLQSDSTAALYDYGSPQVTFNTNGFDLSSDAGINATSSTYASWTFRKQPKFFDIVTYTGTGSATTIAHNLASTPGCIIVKRTDTSANWQVYHVGFGSPSVSAQLNLFAAPASATTVWNSTAPTSTVFSVGTSTTVNASGGTYVAYLFASNAGGFGLTGTDNVITCGTVTGAGDTTYVPIDLGYEAQWLLTKRLGATGGWNLLDNMRGWVATANGNELLNACVSDAATSGEFFGGSPSATGVNFLGNSGVDYIYIAIRRGPMKTPTLGTTVFGITTAAGTSPAYVSSFPVDVALRYQITGGDPTLQARLAGATKMFTNYADAEGADSNVTWYYQNGMFTTVGANSNQYGWLMKRAPSFMDVVCYTGNGTSGATYTHNLTVVPELMILKTRSGSQSWIVYTAPTGNAGALYLSSTAALETAGGPGYFNNTTPTSTQFTVGNYTSTNPSGGTMIAYLFATLAGVSKVGSYTGNGTTQTVNCGFTTGARFVIIKRTDSTGGWYVYDTVRGMTVLADPYFFLNNPAAQVATLGSVTTVSTGFALNSTILAAINESGGNYIFLAIA